MLYKYAKSLEYVLKKHFIFTYKTEKLFFFLSIFFLSLIFNKNNYFIYKMVKYLLVLILTSQSLQNSTDQKKTELSSSETYDCMRPLYVFNFYLRHFDIIKIEYNDKDKNGNKYDKNRPTFIN